jgi:hypothetical protein
MNDGDRFALAVTQVVGKRLTYAELTGKESKKGSRFLSVRRFDRAGGSGRFSLPLRASPVLVLVHNLLIIRFTAEYFCLGNAQDLCNQGGKHF